MRGERRARGARCLHVEEALVLEHVAAVGEEELEVGDAHVLRHLDGRDDVEEQLLLRLARVLLGQGGRHLAVVAHEDLALALLELVLLVGLGELLLGVVVAAPLGALLAQRHADGLGAILLGRPTHEGAPAAADVEVTHTWLEEAQIMLSLFFCACSSDWSVPW